MARISIPHTVPVQVIVNTETGFIERVVVIDRALAPDYDNGRWENRDDCTGFVTPEEKAAAMALVEGPYEWPVWEIGW